MSQSRLHLLLATDVIEDDSLQSVIATAGATAHRNAAELVVTLLGRRSEQALGAAREAGAARILIASHPAISTEPQGAQLAAAFAQAINTQNSASVDRTLWLLPAGAPNEEIAAQLAVQLDGTLLGKCSADIELDATGLSVSRAGLGGRATIRLHSEQGPWFATVRGIKQAASTASPTSAPRIESIELSEPLPHPFTIQRKPAPTRTADPSHSDVVVSGGRGVGDAEGFALLQKLATSLGGAWAGSLPAVDAGWVPVARQVGQSGCYVAPALYVAVGISGTPQHMAGIGPDTRIVAINTDAEADIFRFAELGIVADWRQVLPALLRQLEQRGEVGVAQP